MKRFLILASVSLLVGVAGVGYGGPVSSVKQQLPQIPQLSNQTYTLEFKGGERALAIASGDGAYVYVGLYVFDSQGNCVAWDDDGSWITRDDLAVDWYPRENGLYTVEVSNCGLRTNQCKVIIR